MTDKYTIKHRLTGKVLYSGDDLRYADLRYADLRYANLRGANLRYAILYIGNIKVVPA